MVIKVIASKCNFKFVAHKIKILKRNVNFDLFIKNLIYEKTVKVCKIDENPKYENQFINFKFQN